MSITVIMLEMLAFAALFTTIIFSYYRGDRKYSASSIHMPCLDTRSHLMINTGLR